MSGVPKRLHEEGGHSTPLKRPHEELVMYSSPSGKANQSVGNEFHLPLDHGHEGRVAKVQRLEAREVDKRSSLLHRMPSASISSLDHPITSENRLDLKRNVKSESWEDKEHRTDKGDCRNDTKFEKDYAAANAHLNWKDSKEHHRSRRSAADGLNSWSGSRSGLQSANELTKDLLISEDRSVETLDRIGDNKIDQKVEEKFRDKDRKTKERDFGEKDKDKNGFQNNMLLGGTSDEHKDLLREEKDMEKWERERKDLQKDKEWNMKDTLKRETSAANEKDTLQSEKEFIDGSVRSFEQDNTTSEPKRGKFDSWKIHEKDMKEKKREVNGDAGERPEQRGKHNDKELDDSFVDGDGATDKEKEAFGNVQQRRRLRTRGTPQTPQREGRPRSKARDNEGSQGKSDASAIVYKAGECMQELMKSWKEFKASQDVQNEKILQDGPTLEIRIPAEYITSTNRQVKGAQLWGTDIYSNDSDLVAVLMHTGYISTSSRPPHGIQELCTTVRVLPSQECYTSTLRNNVRSRAWGAGIDCSFRVERCCIVKKCGGTIDLEPRLTYTSAVEPTIAPISVERTMTTRAAASNALRHQRFVREVTIQYNLCNEPWLKYTINIVADKGLKKPLYTSARLKKGEVLYLETHFNRYELCFNGEKPIPSTSKATDLDHEKLQNHGLHASNGDRNSTEHETVIDVFRWSRCKTPLPEKLMRSSGIPLPMEHLEILYDNLDWEDIQWSQTGVWVSGKEYLLARVHFLSPN
ncbi:uncharacterized protein LOC121969515 [Zingiber officinale]|uniref:uncharacterized protein LOC121969515 n=1 Tax=Zingiber officinale TaxID=94328 RepID=UPI001C4C80DD|nr:uncharacterized protein LOC121969515 [Zingiber officinale]